MELISLLEVAELYRAIEPVTTAALISGGASILGGLFGSRKKVNTRALAAANRYAAQKQYEAAMASIAAWEKHNYETRKDFKPWREQGTYAIARLQEGLESGAFENAEFKIPDEKYLQLDPGYQFRLKEGYKAINRKNNAASGVNSGEALKELQQYGSNEASSEYGSAYQRAIDQYTFKEAGRRDYFNRLVNRGAAGRNANVTVANVGGQAASHISAANRQGATALGAGRLGSANAEIYGTISNNQLASEQYNKLVGSVGLGVDVYNAINQGRKKLPETRV